MVWSKTIRLVFLLGFIATSDDFLQRENSLDYKITVISAEKTLNTKNMNTRESEKNGCQIVGGGLVVLFLIFFFHSFCNALQVFMWG